jgi:steroid 5-alpha reductase family enzyme
MRPTIGADLWLIGRDFNYQGDKQQWAYGGAPSAAIRWPIRPCAAPTSC